MTPKVPETRAWQALVALIEKSSQTAVADLAGMKQPTVSLIANLQRLPSRRTSLALEKIGIKREWWDQPARRRGPGRAA